MRYPGQNARIFLFNGVFDKPATKELVNFNDNDEQYEGENTGREQVTNSDWMDV